MRQCRCVQNTDQSKSILPPVINLSSSVAPLVHHPPQEQKLPDLASQIGRRRRHSAAQGSLGWLNGSAAFELWLRGEAPQPGFWPRKNKSVSMELAGFRRSCGNILDGYLLTCDGAPTSWPCTLFKSRRYRYFDFCVISKKEEQGKFSLDACKRGSSDSWRKFMILSPHQSNGFKASL